MDFGAVLLLASPTGSSAVSGGWKTSLCAGDGLHGVTQHSTARPRFPRAALPASPFLQPPSALPCWLQAHVVLGCDQQNPQPPCPSSPALLLSNPAILCAALRLLQVGMLSWGLRAEALAQGLTSAKSSFDGKSQTLPQGTGCCQKCPSAFARG